MPRVLCSTIEEAVYYLTNMLSSEMRRQIGVMEREQLGLLYDVLGRTILSHLDLARNKSLVTACRPRYLRQRFEELSQIVLKSPGATAEEKTAFRLAFSEWRALRDYLDGKSNPPDTPNLTPEVAAHIILSALWDHLRL